MPYDPISRNDRELQRTIYQITELLGMLRRCGRHLRQSSRIEKEISIAVTKLEFLIGEYENVATATDEQKPYEYQLDSRPVCADCRQGETKVGTGRQAGQGTEVITPPMWQSSLQFALSCTRLVADDYLSDPATWGTFPRCLVELQTVLRRLQKLLPASATAETKLSVADFPNACAECGKSLEVVP
jgi:hypothetical protein